MTGLFLIGPSSTGKTTRARRALAECQQSAPRKTARAVPAKELMEEACAAIRADRFERWRDQVCDLGFLVIEHLEMTGQGFAIHQIVARLVRGSPTSVRNPDDSSEASDE